MPFLRPSGVVFSIISRVLLTVNALNILTATPIPRVRAKPDIRLAPNLCPNQKSIALVIKVETLLSLMDVHALLNPISIAEVNVRPNLNSSFILSKIRMLASTAIPIERMKAATPASVKVMGTSLNMLRIAAV